MSFEICMRVTRPLVEGEGVRCWRLPPARLAFMRYRGSYDTIFHAYIELMVWVVEHGHAAVGPLREQAIVAGVDTDDDSRWVTEIALPVAASA